MQEIARKEEKKGKNVWVGYGRIKINGEWWRWDEEEEALKDEKGNKIWRKGGRESGEGRVRRIEVRREKGGGEKRKSLEEKDWKIGFWNVAGLANKDREFWEGLKNWEVMVLVETWTDTRVEGGERKVAKGI